MKVALVHDYLADYGGAERVLESLCRIYPDAPIYTAFYRPDTPAYEHFKDKQIIPSWAQMIPGFAKYLHSPLRFLAREIWESFDFSDYDAVISSSSWYITKAIKTPNKTLHVCYMHTPPRYLYGYETSSSLGKYWPVKVYAAIVNKYLRQYDYITADRVDEFIANSEEVKGRIAKFYRRDATVIYPPVDITSPSDIQKQDYLLTGGRLVGAKHYDAIIRAANQLKAPLKIYGTGRLEEELKALAGPTVEFLGRVTESELAKLYAEAKAFVALATDEDFGITPVEAMACGTPVIAYHGGGFKETVIEGKTGLFVHSHDTDELVDAIRKVGKTKFTPSALQKHAAQFSSRVFERKIKDFVDTKYKEYQA